MSVLDVSVCICTYNRKDSLEQALASLASMRAPRGTSFEVIVVDNNSSDGTAELLGELDPGPLPLRYVLEARQGLSHARNRAVAEARGSVIAFLDDDVVVEPDWLERLHSAFRRDPRPAVVAGPALLDADLPRPDWWHEEFDGPAGHFYRGDEVLSTDDGYTGMIGIGANMAFSSDLFGRYGSFRTDLGRTGGSLAMGEELEFLDRLRESAERLVYDPTVVVHHRPDLGRISRSYLRRWYLHFGEWSFEKERETPGVRVLGLPRWRFRYLLEEIAGWARAVIRRQRDQALLHRMHLVSLAGHLKRAWSTRG